MKIEFVFDKNFEKPSEQLIKASLGQLERLFSALTEEDVLRYKRELVAVSNAYWGEYDNVAGKTFLFDVLNDIICDMVNIVVLRVTVGKVDFYLAIDVSEKRLKECFELDPNVELISIE